MINLGSPDSTSVPDVKKYLDEFLMDKRVIGKKAIGSDGFSKGDHFKYKTKKISKSIQKDLVERRFSFDCFISKIIRKGEKTCKNSSRIGNEIWIN